MKRLLASETINKVGETVIVAGWVHARRDMGKVVFFDLRDDGGVENLLQIVCVPADLGDDGMATVNNVRAEWVIQFEGVVQARGEKQVNHKLQTGTVELLAKKITVLNEAKTPPFEVDKDTADIDEKVRLKHRYLDLRTDRLQKNIRTRSAFVQKIREFLFKRNFTEIETPLLTKATPEGSRDFIVPSRLQPGKFFALPQSPQQYKQLIMASGFEKYFQIARALRDEDPRADRGFEHTQVDLEMAFVDREDVMNTVEAMMIEVAEGLGKTVKEKPFPRISYKDAMDKYGADKFDLRTNEEKEAAVLSYAWVIDFPFFEPDKKGGWTFTHNPFSNPLPESREDLLKGENIENILTSQYDLICNGYEAGGGSIRAHEPDILRATYKVMGYSDEEIEESVGHMLAAFEYGAPPHGGIALGVERNVMTMREEEYLREVQAFPMTGSAMTSVMNAPGPLSDEAMQDAHIKLDL